MMRRNGFLVTTGGMYYNGRYYSGICNGPWPIEESELGQCFTEWECRCFEKIIDNGVFSEEDGALLDNLDMVKKYCTYCNDNGIKYRLLYIEVLKSIEDIKNISTQARQSETFLGFDVGQCYADFYSALLCDIILRPYLFEYRFLDKLNENGLFSTYEDAKLFVQERERKKKVVSFLTFEEGYQDIIGIYEVKLQGS